MLPFEMKKLQDEFNNTVGLFYKIALESKNTPEQIDKFLSRILRERRKEFEKFVKEHQHNKLIGEIDKEKEE